MIFHWIALIIIILLPLYLWAYATNMLDEKNTLSRGRFWAGIFSGVLSVGLTWILSKYQIHTSPWVSLGVFVGVFVLLYGLVYIYTQLGSRSSRDFLRRVAWVHLVGIFGLLVIIFLLSYFLTGSFGFGVFLLPIFIAAFFEETTKHLTTLGLVGGDFHFSRREIVLFAFYVVLGFVFIENILYIHKYGFDLWIWFFRSTFTFSAHLLSATICTLAWWQALSYPLTSLRYFTRFFLGFLLASLVHMFYNYFAGLGNIWVLILYLAVAYIVFTQALLEKSGKSAQSPLR